MTTKEIQKALKAGKFTLTDVIDAFIELNGIIGVGRITLADDIRDYINQSSAKTRKAKEA